MDLIQRKYGLSERPLLLLQDAVLPEFEVGTHESSCDVAE